MRRRYRHHRKHQFKWFLPVIIVVLLILLSPLLRLIWSPFNSFITWAPSLLNSNILVLLQNEAEQRPGGGFISALGIIEIHWGKPQIKIIDSRDD